MGKLIALLTDSDAHEVTTGELLLQVDSKGYLEIAINQGNAGERLNVAIHDIITLLLG